MFLGTSYEWNYIIFVCLCLAYFSKDNVKVNPCCSMYQNCIPFYGDITFHCMDCPRKTELGIS